MSTTATWASPPHVTSLDCTTGRNNTWTLMDIISVLVTLIYWLEIQFLHCCVQLSEGGISFPNTIILANLQRISYLKLHCCVFWTIIVNRKWKVVFHNFVKELLWECFIMLLISVPCFSPIPLIRWCNWVPYKWLFNGIYSCQQQLLHFHSMWNDTQDIVMWGSYSHKRSREARGSRNS